VACSALLACSALPACSALLAGCSAPPEYALPRPDPPGTVLLPPPAGAADVACAGEGEVLAADAGAGCCMGLGPVPFYKGSVIRLDTCEPEGKGRATCLRCGDGRCGKGENACNCPADCPP
jgi:hypothetical protein